MLAGLVSVAACSGQGPGRRYYHSPESTKTRQLSKVDLFPKKYKVAIETIIIELKRDREEPADFYASIEPYKNSKTLIFHLWHKSAFNKENRRLNGNPGGKCRDFYYDPGANRVTKKLFWQ